MNNPLIVISNGMAKSGSTLLFNYTWDLINRQLPDNGQAALCDAVFSGRLAGVKRTKGAGMVFFSEIGDRELDMISEIASSEGPVVIKTHSDARPVLVNALQRGRIRMTFTHRDPRDMILSAMDHCIQTRDSDDPSMQEFTSIQASIASSRAWAQKACNWVSSGLPHIIRYTDLVSRPATVLARTAEYLGIPAGTGVLDTVIANELAMREFGRMRFNRGELNRYRGEMSPEDQAFCKRELGELITKLGYHL